MTEAEAAFRIQKSGSQLRPVGHQKRERVEAQILVYFLSFVVSKTLGNPHKERVILGGHVFWGTRLGGLLILRCRAGPPCAAEPEQI